VETVPGPTNQPAPAVQSGAALKSAQGISETPVQSQKPAESGNKQQRDQLVTQHFHLVPQVVRMMQKKGWSVRDDDAAESAAMDGLMKAAEKWDGSTDFATYAKNGMAQAIKNLNRRKGDKMTSNASATDDGEGNDLLSGVASRESDSGYGDDEKENLNKAIASLPSNQDQWLVRAWFTGEDEDGNTMNQSQVADQFNSRFGKTLTRQALGARATKLITQLRDTLVDPDQYAAVRNMVIRYYKTEILTMQKERYERRQERVIREAAEYTESDPTDAQIQAGNYKKGRFTWNGMQIVIENPRGSMRRGVSSNGEIWRREMTAHYGYISGTEGTDGDQVDVFIGKHPESELVFVVHQIDQSTGQFDELKVVLGETNMKKAKELYLSNYSKGWKCGEIEPMTVAQFKELLESGGCC
jgi:RNA polymerase sigma factor (sigma-70 family)